MRKILFLCLLFSHPLVLSQPLKIKVVTISKHLAIQTLSSTGLRHTYLLSGTQKTAPHTKTLRNAHKRLKQLLIGKVIDIDVKTYPYAIFYWAGININIRMIEEGLLLVNEHHFNQFNQAQQLQFLTAQQKAKQNQRGIWSLTSQNQRQRFYEPQDYSGLPLPWINAPVFIP